ncbi:MAG: Skp family chaperone for outer membrane protein [Flavobacteriales bacterium]|jgi:Skp family chaperone for outer membrane proteins
MLPQFKTTYFIKLMKKVIFTIAMAVIASTTFAQTQTKEKTEITSIKPVDGSPVVFSSQEELDAKIDDKIEKIKVQIRANANDPKKVEYLRMELWRFENAIVSTKK